MNNCIFCKIVNKEIPSIKIYEDDIVLAFADINPIAQGHTLIIPKKHAADIWEIEPWDLAAIHEIARKIAQAMKKSLQPEGIAFLQLNGEGVNQVVKHYHLHLIPRMPGTPEIALTHWELKPGDMEVIQETAEKIAGAVPR